MEQYGLVHVSYVNSLKVASQTIYLPVSRSISVRI
jgi:hypothetical protein